MVLTNKQKEELDKSILGYFKSHDYTDAYDAFLATLQSTTPDFPPPSGEHMDMLDKKWSSIIRMNRKIMELEATCSSLREDVEAAGKGKGKTDQSAVLPKEMAKLTLKGHRDGIKAVKFHPVFSLIATASEDATIKVWDYESGQLERTLQGHQDSVQDLDFNAAGTLLASCSVDLSVKLWNFEDSEYSCRKTLQGHDHSVSAVAWLPAGDFLLSGSRDKSIKLWEVATGYCVRTFAGHEQWVRGLAVHPSGLTFASASMDQSVKLWTVKTGEVVRTLKEHEHVVEVVVFSNALADGFIHASRVEEAKTNGTPIPHLNGFVPSAAAASASASSSSSSASASASSSSAAASSSSATAAASAAGGAYMASGSRDRSVRIWDVATGTLVKTLVAHDNWVSGLVFHPSGRYLLSCSDDKSVRIWDLSRGFRPIRKMAEAHESFVSCLAWNSNPPLMATGGVDSVTKVWDCR